VRVAAAGADVGHPVGAGGGAVAPPDLGAVRGVPAGEVEDAVERSGVGEEDQAGVGRPVVQVLDQVGAGGERGNAQEGREQADMEFWHKRDCTSLRYHARMLSPRAVLRFTPFTVLLVAAVVSAAPPRPIELAVDATDAPRGIFHSRLTIPVAPGPLTLAYPKWIQGEHAPTGPIQQVAGFTVSAAGKVLPWRRDPVDPFLVRLEVPAGAAAVEVTLDCLSPP